MLALRVLRGVLRGLRALWIAWAVFCGGMAALVVPAGARACLLVCATCVALPASIVVHEYGHARAALALGARQLAIVRSGVSVAILHEPLDRRSNALVSLSGPAGSAIGGLLIAAGALLVRDMSYLVPAVVVGCGAFSILPWSHDGRQLLALTIGRAAAPIEEDRPLSARCRP